MTRPATYTPGHQGIPSTTGYSHDVEGCREWLDDVVSHVHYGSPDPSSDVAPFVALSRLQRLALRLFRLTPYVRVVERRAHAEGRMYVANTVLAAFLSDSGD